jgi:hypothetical protein
MAQSTTARRGPGIRIAARGRGLRITNRSIARLLGIDVAEDDEKLGGKTIMNTARILDASERQIYRLIERGVLDTFSVSLDEAKK